MSRPGSTPVSVSGFTAACVVVANMVGTGVFTSLGFQVVSISSGFVLLGLWCVGGLCALCGALCYAELGAALPRSGGEYALLTRIYGRPMGFLAAWVSMTAGFPAAVALSALAFGRYLNGMVAGIPASAAALAVLAAVTCVHWAGIEMGSAFQRGVTVLKVFLIVLVTASGLFVPKAGSVSFRPESESLGEFLGAPFAISLVFVMFAYSGWNAATYISSEIESPAKSIPGALLSGTGVVIALYLGLNWFFLATAPLEALKGNVEVGLIAGLHAFGPVGGKVMSSVICLLLVSSISSMVWVGPRVTMVLGEDYPRIGLLARKSECGTPRVALTVQTAVTLALILTGTFEAVLMYLQFVLLASSFATAMGVIVLRRREPDLPRPYRVWGYPFTPGVFLACSLWMMGFVLVQKTRESLTGLTVLGLGLVLYGFIRNEERSPDSSPESR